MEFSAYMGIFLRALVCAAVLGAHVSSAQQQNGSSSALLPANILVHKGIAALGGKKALESVTSAIYQVAE